MNVIEKGGKCNYSMPLSGKPQAQDVARGLHLDLFHTQALLRGADADVAPGQLDLVYRFTLNKSEFQMSA